ncbi:MAG: hypothetical protein DMG51_12535 [Acidobacteria bacterium]|nr:MAG: hypothetical protein DMG51_12535 [Acidobacteriota bacterium]
MFSEYPAAHGCFSGASTETLNYLFGTDEVGFSMDSTVAGVVNAVRCGFRKIWPHSFRKFWPV